MEDCWINWLFDYEESGWRADVVSLLALQTGTHMKSNNERLRGDFLRRERTVRHIRYDEYNITR